MTSDCADTLKSAYLVSACRQLMAELNLTILTLLHTYIYMLILCTTFEVLSVYMCQNPSLAITSSLYR